MSARRDGYVVGLASVVLTVLLAGCAGLTGTGGASPDATPTAPTAAASAGRTGVDVIPVGTMAGTSVVSAGGYVQGVIEMGGTCTFTLTQGSATVTGRSDAEPDATTTRCPNVDLTLPQPGAPWSLELAYASATSTGTGHVTSDGVLS